jgi:hypothetical protein
MKLNIVLPKKRTEREYQRNWRNSFFLFPRCVKIEGKGETLHWGRIQKRRSLNAGKTIYRLPE